MSLRSELHERYADVRVLRATRSFRTLAVRSAEEHRPRVVIAPGAHTDRARALAALERAEWAHRTIAHPRVPRSRGIVEVAGKPALELECDAVGDALELFRRISGSSRRMTYPIADAFIVGIREAMQAAHRVTDPRTGGPLALGRMSGANVLFGSDGRTWLVGLGHNVALEDEHGHPDPQLPHFQAPEIALGGAASPSGDYLALHLFMRSGIPHVDKGDVFARILKAIASRSDDALRELLVWIERRIVGSIPEGRASVDEAVEVAQRIRDVLGVVPDPEGFARFVAATFADPKLEPRAEDRHGSALTVGPEAEWIGWNLDDRIRLRGPMRRVVLALVAKQQLGSPAPVRSVDLVEIGWPEERIEHEAALNRVYVTLNRLRKLLPEGVIERHDDGYRLRPDVTVLRSDFG